MTSNPHDALFKFVFSQVAHAQSLLRAVLPADLVERLQWESLECVARSFVEPSLREVHSDLVFRTRASDPNTDPGVDANADVLVYVLVEHKSYPDPWIELQLLTYLTRMWNELRAEREQQEQTPQSMLPAIVPVVLYHGESRWTPPPLSSRIQGPTAASTWQRYVPRFDWIYVDLSTEDALRNEPNLTPLAFLGVELLRHGRRAVDLAQRLRSWASNIRNVARSPGGGDALEALFRYVFTVSDYIGVDELPKILEDVADDSTREAVMTLEQRLIEKGRREGGRLALVGMTERLLTLRFGPLPSAVTARVHDGSVDDLMVWAERVVTAPSLDSIFSDDLPD